MQDNQLSVSSGGGSSQGSSSQSIQSASSGSFLPGQKSSAVQTGTPTAALNSNTGGIQLNPTSPTIVNVSDAPSTISTTKKTEPAKQPHNTSPVAAGLSIILVVAAIILLWSAMRPVKKTTD